MQHACHNVMPGRACNINARKPEISTRHGEKSATPGQRQRPVLRVKNGYFRIPRDSIKDL